MKKLFIIAIIAFGVTASGCSSIGSKAQSVNEVTKNTDGSVSNTVKNQYVSQKTLQIQEKSTLAQAVCLYQSKQHNSQRLVIETAPTVIVNGVYIETTSTKFYNPSIKPFNMAGCVEETMRWGGERLVSKALDIGKDLLTLGIKGWAAYEITKTVVDNTGVSINGVESGASVSVGTDQAPSSSSIDNRTGENAGDNSTFNLAPEEEVPEEEVPVEEPPIEEPPVEVVPAV